MAIERIQRISNTAPSSAVSSVTSASKNLQSQLQMKQQTLKKISTDSHLSVDEKEKQRQELQKEIEALKRKLEQMRLKQEESEKTEKTEQRKEIDLEKVSKSETEKEENEKFAVDKSEEDKRETKELSADEVQKMLDTNLFLKEEMVQQGADYDHENVVRLLSSEIKQDEIHGSDTSDKKEELKELREKENFWVEAKNKNDEQNPPHLMHPDAQLVVE